MSIILYKPKYHTSLKAAQRLGNIQYRIRNSVVNVNKNNKQFSINYSSIIGYSLISNFLLGNIIDNMNKFISLFIDGYFYITANATILGINKISTSYDYIKLRCMTEAVYDAETDKWTIIGEDVQGNQFPMTGTLDDLSRNIRYGNINNTSPININAIIEWDGSNYLVLSYTRRDSRSYSFSVFDINRKIFTNINLNNSSIKLIEDKTLLEECKKIYSEYKQNIKLEKFLKKGSQIYVIENNTIFKAHSEQRVTNRMNDNELLYYVIKNGYIIPTGDVLKKIEEDYSRFGEIQKETEEKIKKIIKDAHGDNCYFDGRKDEKRAILHYPEIIIKNNRGQSHKIRDLYISIDLYNDFKVKGLCGMRGILTTYERSAGYAHSHLSGLNYTSFCLGGSSVSDLYRQLNKNFDEDKFEMLVYELENLASWESLEGGPYCRMEDVLSRQQNNSGSTIRNFASDQSTIKSLSKKLVRHIKTSYILPKQLIKKTFRKGIPYVSASLKEFSDSLLEQIGFQKVVIQGNKEYKSNDYINFIKKDFSSAPKSVISTSRIKYKGETLKTYVDPSLDRGAVSNISESDIKIEISKKQISRVEDYLTKLI